VFLICVVAAFNVVGMLTMVVRDKTREIGILLAMGLRRESIRRIFLAQGVLIGVWGTLIGVIGGLVLGGLVDSGHLIRIDPSIYFIDHLPVQVEPLDIGIVVLVASTIALLATLPTSRWAARLEPVEAIRHE
jgi:lipoprotein-releasing system permease protein